MLCTAPMGAWRGPMDSDSLKIRPLGGLGEIGMNCLALSQGESTVAIDCGALFPHDDYGVGRWVPPVAQLFDDDFEGLLLTHGHEDHIGAVAELAAAVMERGRGPLRVWGPAYAVGLVELRLAEIRHGSDQVQLETVQPGQLFEVGPFRIEAVRMTHSIADATALCIESAAGHVVHSGDFKLDPRPVLGEPSDERRLRQLGERGVRLLMSDSTNALRQGWSASEASVAEALDEEIRAQPGRVVVGIFSSNVHRLKALGQVALATGRKLCLLGRSMRKHATLARRLGYLAWPSDLVLSPFAAKQQAPSRILYLATGTQGEERGALRRLALGQLKDVRLDPTDTVLLSSRIIPGCEAGVYSMYNAFVRRGIRLITQQSHPRLHASGHAYEEEQRTLLRWLRPDVFMPLHGTTMHLQRHAAIARDEGVEQVELLHDGEILQLGPGAVRRELGHPALPVALGAGQQVSAEVLQQRKKLGQGGIVVVAIHPSTEAQGPLSWEAKVDGVNQVEQALTTIAGLLGTAHARSAEAIRTPEARAELQRELKRRLVRELGERPSVCLLFPGHTSGDRARLEPKPKA